MENIISVKASARTTRRVHNNTIESILERSRVVMNGPITRESIATALSIEGPHTQLEFMNLQAIARSYFKRKSLKHVRLMGLYLILSTLSFMVFNIYRDTLVEEDKNFFIMILAVSIFAIMRQIYLCYITDRRRIYMSEALNDYSINRSFM